MKRNPVKMFGRSGARAILPIPLRSPATYPLWPDLTAMQLFEEPFVVAAPASHRFARMRRKQLRESDLADEQVLLLEDGHCLRDQALSVCQLAGAREAEHVRGTSLNTLVQMVGNRLGITLLPVSAVDAEVRGQEDIAIRPFKPPPPSREIGLVWRRASARGDEFQLLGKLLQRHVP